MNLSLGHTVTGPASTDPLCLAVERPVAGGLVVVASAGNNGKDAAGQHACSAASPRPATRPRDHRRRAQHLGHRRRGDDTVASYSSRGPTRFDLRLKPDLVAPGNKIVSLEAAGRFLADHYPGLHVAGSGTNAYSTMSGTSMAAAMVSGSAALLLQAAPP